MPRVALCVLPVLGALPACGAGADVDAGERGKRTFFSRQKVEGVLASAYHPEGLLVRPGVFDPGEADDYILPLMERSPELFRGKRTLDIGAGSGTIGLYAARLGASKVVATDIDPEAIACVVENAARMGFEDVVDARLVPPEDISAYSVVGSDEQFDVIVTNAPYSLDLDAVENTPAVDRGDLGLSIVRGLDRHLAPGGVALLYYNSLFYHQLMAKFARRRGYEVRQQLPSMLTPWEAETLFNSYLERFLELEGIEGDGLWFRRKELYNIRVASSPEPLFPGNPVHSPGMIVVAKR